MLGYGPAFFGAFQCLLMFTRCFMAPFCWGFGVLRLFSVVLVFIFCVLCAPTYYVLRWIHKKMQRPPGVFLLGLVCFFGGFGGVLLLPGVCSRPALLRFLSFAQQAYCASCANYPLKGTQSMGADDLGEHQRTPQGTSLPGVTLPEQILVAWYCSLYGRFQGPQNRPRGTGNAGFE